MAVILAAMIRKRWLIAVVAVCAILPAVPWFAVAQPQPQACAGEPGRVIECIKPSATDPAIRRFDAEHYVLFNTETRPDAELLVFLPGTGGEPPGPLALLRAAADAGYRVISLAYNDTPAVAVYCPRQPDPACSERFRRMRVYGDGTVDRSIDNTRAESIVNRLVKLLQYLDAREPQRKWGGYLDNGALNFSRIVFAGQSQGAGMAAFIAKAHAVARVILFSSPWDFTVSNGSVRSLAPWISKPPMATPPARWYGAYHQRENTADLIAKAYAALRIPPDHIRVFSLDLPPQRQQGAGGNPFHSEGIRNPAYAADRTFLLGRSR
jgi:predicted esterase